MRNLFFLLGFIWVFLSILFAIEDDFEVCFICLCTSNVFFVGGVIYDKLNNLKS